MKRYLIQFTIAVVMTFLGSACSDKNSTSNTITTNSENPNYEFPYEIKTQQKQENESIVVESLQDLNHDGIKDSLLYDYEWKEDEEKFTIFFGRKDGGYDQIKEYTYGKEWAIAPYIAGDTMLIAGRGCSYAFKYRNGQFILIGYEVHTNMPPNFELDFDNQKIIYKLDRTYCANGSQTYVRKIDMTEEKVPQNYSLENFFDSDDNPLYEYLNYKDWFHQYKIDSLARDINSDFLEHGTKYIDNDKQLYISYKDSNYELKLSFDRTNISTRIRAKLEDIITRMMMQVWEGSNNKYNPMSNIVGAYVELQRLRKSVVNEANMYNDSYSIEGLYADDKYSTYCIKRNYGYDDNNKGKTIKKYITYNNIGDELTTYLFYEKEMDVHKLLIEGLMKNMDSKEKVLDINNIPFPKSEPFIIGDTIVFRYQNDEISEYGLPDCPESKIHIKDIIPYFNNDGMNFINCDKRKFSEYD